MSNIVVYDLQKPGGDIVRLSLAEYQGKRFADLRLWVEAGGDHKATRKGVSVPLDRLSELADAFHKAAAMTKPTGRKNGS